MKTLSFSSKNDRDEFLDENTKDYIQDCFFDKDAGWCVTIIEDGLDFLLKGRGQQ